MGIEAIRLLGSFVDSGLPVIRYLTLALGFLLGASVFFEAPWLRRQRVLLLRVTLIGVASVVLGEPILTGLFQYLAWRGSPITAALVTGEHWTYIYLYTWGRFLAWRVVGAVAAGVIYWLSMRFIVKPSNGFKLSRDEAILIAIGIALAGWPGFVLYMMALLLLYVGILAVHTVRGGGDARFSVALPATLALITIPFIQQLLVWASNASGINFLLYNVTNLSL